MTLRPRYSLLALLVLTALVAGGVKLWRGPHRVSVSDPSNAFERDLLHWGGTFGFSSSEIRYEYDYVRSWSGPQVLSVTGVFTSNYFLIVPRSGPHPNNALGLKYLYSEAEPGKYHFPQLVPASKERIHCWLHSGRCLMNSEREYFYGVMPVPAESRMLSSQPSARE